MTQKILLSWIIFWLIRSAVWAQCDQIIVGTRPQSLGEAFLAVADDGNAIYWNPAGLARMERIQTSFSYSDLFGIGLHSYYLSFLSRLYFIPPLTDYLTFGVDWSAIKLADDEELEFSRNELHFALGVRPSFISRYLKDLSLGFSATYLTMFSQGYNVTETEVDASGWGGNFGLLYHFDSLKILPGKLNVGLMIHDVGGLRIKHDTDKWETILNQNIRWGLSYRPFEEFPGGKIPLSDPLLAIDLDDRIHVGLEFWLAHVLALRAGIQKDRHTKEKVTLSFGLGFRANLKDWPGANVDYAITDSPVLPNTNKNFSGSIILKEDPRLIRIEGGHIKDVFASLYRHYGLPGQSIGSVKLRNLAREPLKVWLSIAENRYVQSQKADTLIIAPESTIDFPLRVVFKPEITTAMSGRYTNEINMTYLYKKNDYTSKVAIDYELYGLNYLTWDDPGKAAAFVTSSDDPAVQEFTNRILTAKQNLETTNWFFRFTMADAVMLFNALRAYGFCYRRDPVTPVDTLRGGIYRQDMIRYPAQLLSQKNRQDRGGDCDDLTVLYASLLQNAGIATAFLSVPGHIFLMFDSGIPKSARMTLPIAPDLFIERNNTLWVPIEATKIASSDFIDAWRTAAKVFADACDKGCMEIYDVAEYQAKYPVVPYEFRPPTPGLPPLLPDSTLQQGAFALDELKLEYYRSLEDSLKIKDLELKVMLRKRNRYGVILGQNGDLVRSQAEFQKILADSNYAPAWNNLGNIEFISGNFNKAEIMYQRALKVNPFSRGTYINAALVYQMMRDSTGQGSIYQTKSDTMILKAAQLLEGNVATAFSILGFEEERSIGKEKSLIKGLKRRIINVKNYIDRNFKKFVRGEEIQVILDRGGAKGDGIYDPDWGEILYWSYE